jgi:prepilin-type N-terminal cleavage/methylation domain-containing protein
MNTRKGRSAMLEKISGVITTRIHDETDRSDEEGFTLIELLIVVIVLGILAAVTVFGLSGSASQSAKSACRSDARTTEVAVDAFHAESPTGAWPTQGAGITDLLNPGNANAYAGWGGTVPTPAPFLRTTPGNAGHYSIGLIHGGDQTDHVTVTPVATYAGSTDFEGTNGAVCDAVT